MTGRCGNAGLIEGLDDGRWAVLITIHHCIADGIATMHVFSRLGDSSEAPSYDIESAMDILAAAAG